MTERMLDGRYKLRREIQKSRRCTVFQAQHRYTQRIVALKQLHRSLATRSEERDTLFGEARLLSEIRHACVPDVLDAGEVDDEGVATPYIVMEMVDGRSLAGLLAARRRLETPAAVALAQALAATLRAVHESGVVHLDVSPRNIMLPTARADRQLETRGAPIKLMDFTEAVRSLLSDAAVRAGDDEYRAPEQLAGDATDERVDLFSVGVIVYECLAGVLPYSGDGASRFAAPPPSLVGMADGVTAALDEVVRRAIAPIPSERQRDMETLLIELAHATRDRPTPEPARPLSAPPASLPAKRRKHPRAAYLTPVRVMREDGSSIDSSSEDISVGGMLLLGPELDSDGERVEVRFALPISGRIVKFEATTRWRSQARDGAGATGLQFSDVEQAAREEIAKYVDYFADG